MKALVVAALAAGVVSFGMPAPPAEAGAKSYKSKRYAAKRSFRRNLRSRRGESFEAVLARSADPSGQYAGYPNWARIAFGPRSDGRKGR
ncbi:MAG: hypothetical protein AAFR04_06460 [Pseudomonadota bacterium]